MCVFKTQVNVAPCWLKKITYVVACKYLLNLISNRANESCKTNEIYLRTKLMCKLVFSIKKDNNYFYFSKMFFQCVIYLLCDINSYA